MNYLNVVCKPLFVTYLILVNDVNSGDEITNMIMKEGIEKNQKNLATRIDDSQAK